MLSILKFGGTSLQNGECINRSIQIVKNRLNDSEVVIVVSALNGVTDLLLELVEYSSQPPYKYAQTLARFKDIHQSALSELGISKTPHVKNLFDELKKDLKQGQDLQQEAFGEYRDRILSYGERFAAHIFAEALKQTGEEATSYEAQHFIRTNDHFGEAEVIYDTTRSLIRERFKDKLDHIPVITGFIGQTQDNRLTTLGRSGSDYTAGIFAEALRADRLEIWTDVNGVMTADPKLIPTAQTLDELNYEDITELARHGAKVIHPKTVSPLYELNIPLHVKNSFNPDHPGTLITADYPSNGAFKSVSISGPYVHLDLHSHSEEIMNRIVDASVDRLEDGQSAVSHIKSHYNEQQISLILKAEQYQHLKDQLEKHEDVQIRTEHVYQLKLFNESLQHNTRLLQRALKILDEKNIYPLEIRHASGKRFASIFVRSKQAQLAARLINDHLCLDERKINLFIAGVGAIGSTLLQQIDELNFEGFNMKIVGACNSRSVIWDVDGLDPTRVIDQLEDGQPLAWQEIINWLAEDYHYNTVFVDATGSEEVARYYEQLLKQDIHIVTPSKLANTFDQDYYDQLHKLIHENNVYYEYETTVGAGLPLLETLSDLMNAGDQIRSISGVVSGSLNYILDELEKGTPFSKAVRRAREKGYAEPDPRDDLSGEDVARKFLILARITGQKIERSELNVESLIPDELSDVDSDTFLDNLKKYDHHWKERMEDAVERNHTLRFVGTYRDGEISVGIREVPRESSLGSLSGTDNLIQIQSRRYPDNPLIIQGPGAGKEVTAAGVLADILKIGNIITK